MKVVIRVDASLTMGTGHVMRCLTLAEALKKRGVTVTFICREHVGNLIDRIIHQGFDCYRLAQASEVFESDELYHSSWLGCSQSQDALMCEPILAQLMPDWLVVDHYAIDYRWHDVLTAYYDRLMVIDDLADRKLSADLMLNQNYGADASSYRELVDADCQLLVGLAFALLRPEFVQYRSESLMRRSVVSQQRSLLITMGGVDEKNVTSSVLAIFDDIRLLPNWNIKIVVGEKYPHLEILTKQVTTMSHRHIDLLVGITNMAEVMATSDLAVGAAGATTWERCCLGVPSIQLVIAYNQQAVAKQLADNGVVLMAEKIDDIGSLVKQITDTQLQVLSQHSANLCDGLGVERLVSVLFNLDR